ncbi:MAG: hypothetical protein J6K73_09325, partial [Clostridia bacterium]|nr:hypothetical protein [Clostridia bacterium]
PCPEAAWVDVWHESIVSWNDSSVYSQFFAQDIAAIIRDLGGKYNRVGKILWRAFSCLPPGSKA